MNQSFAIAASVVLAVSAAVIGLAPIAGAVQETSRIASVALPQARPAEKSPVARIKAGEINCRGCNLSGADLSHECVKHGDLTGADFSNTTALYMCMSYANFTDVSFRNADLSGANLSHSNLTRADLSGAKLSITSLKGADLSTVKGLTQAQLDRACADSETKVPAGLHTVSCS
jgi:uncharacterized protein YjbI with pentapeptide repeats